jgi:hypothetical protein
MDIKPVHPTPPPAPLHKVEEQEDMRREQARKRQAKEQRPPRQDESDGKPHIDAYV